MSRIITIKIDKPEPLHEILTANHSPWALSEYAESESFARDLACIHSLFCAEVPIRGILTDLFTSILLHFARRASEVDTALLFLAERTLRINVPEPDGLQELFHLGLNTYHRVGQRQSSYQRWVAQHTIFHNSQDPGNQMLRVYDFLVVPMSLMLIHAGAEIEIGSKGGHWRRYAYERLYLHAQEEAGLRHRAFPDRLVRPDELGLDQADSVAEYGIDTGDEVFDRERLKASELTGGEQPKAKGRRKFKNHAAIVKSIRAWQGSEEYDSEEKPNDTCMKTLSESQRQISRPISRFPKNPKQITSSQHSSIDQLTKYCSTPVESVPDGNTEVSLLFPRLRTPGSSAACSTINYSPLSGKGKEEHADLFILLSSDTSKTVPEEKRPIDQVNVETVHSLEKAEKPEKLIDNEPSDRHQTATTDTEEPSSIAVKAAHKYQKSDEKNHNRRRRVKGRGETSQRRLIEGEVKNKAAPIKAVSLRQATSTIARTIQDETLVELQTMKTDVATVRALSTLRLRRGRRACQSSLNMSMEKNSNLGHLVITVSVLIE